MDTQLTEACFGARLAGGGEVVLLQGSGSFFAVQPVLKALQTVALPLTQ